MIDWENTQVELIAMEQKFKGRTKFLLEGVDSKSIQYHDIIEA